MRPMASGHGTSSSPPPPLPTCVVPLNALVSFLFLWRVSKEGVPSHGITLCFSSENLLEGFKKGRSLFIARASISGGLAIFFFVFCFFFFAFSGERERDIKAPVFPAYPLSL